jgi:hypothetical protein
MFLKEGKKMTELKAKVTAYKNFIIIEPLQFEEDENLIPAGEGRLGTVLINTKKYLGMSKEAVQTLKKLKKSHDDVGDIMLWKTRKGDCFAWFGNMYGLFNIETAEGDKNGFVAIDHVEIPNDVPKNALEAIKKRQNKK